MTPERLARIGQLISECSDERELVGLVWGFKQQGENTTEVMALVKEKADRYGWKVHR